MIEIDPRFREMGKVAQRRRRYMLALRIAAALALAGVVGGGLWWGIRPDLGRLWTGDGDMDQQLTQVEDDFDIAPVVMVDSFTSIPGDPLIIPGNDPSAQHQAAVLPVPPDLVPPQSTPAVTGGLSVLQGKLFQQDHTLVARLPATREEFALFQAERGRAALVNASFDPAEQQPGGLVIPGDQLALSGVTFLRPPAERAPLWEELLIEIAVPGTINDLLVRHQFPAGLAAQVSERLERRGDLAAGSVLAVRYRQQQGVRQIIQVSLYDPDGYAGSLALSGAGQLVPAADPWADQPLQRQNDGAGAHLQQRLLDVIYAAALRNNVPPELIGEALSLMSRAYDLEGFADKDDRLTLVLADQADGRKRILFIGVDGLSGGKPCYVVMDDQGQPVCYAPNARISGAGGGSRLIPPVAGVLIQRFVPAQQGADNPVSGEIIWAAPQDTPVLAVAAGRVSDLSVDPVAGGTLSIIHADGAVSHYRGMHSIAAGIAQGGNVAAGARIGAVGKLADLDEPGLAYRLDINGRAVNPMPYMAGGGEVLASDSVEALVIRIIHVESAGNPNARNPLSTASGLGQFIESTWLRMMRSYRPDLVAAMSRAELLNLRFDPDLSRQMVRQLAQENEAFLRVRGHHVTAGRLYLAHFLGPAGADRVLRADPDRSVLATMGAAVINANPFLRGYTNRDLEMWADRKMIQGGGAQVASASVPVSPEMAQYVRRMDAIITEHVGK
ncbi:MAG: M23 family metallopeptidase [Paracoccus sp. (in: a-proteobacteria)]|uniref:M23 family metallopeptidase n=1 Tax=Paracoccus sp. TaxID=267 RepID=UPI0026DED991|nr:M23 family metallopeptidase [Paracoccus sp. (in: a-proteobacteria)]MDO5622783.1 M23 family metallopeptidase [Paracoccus sp. (in: a-proteobacteria)]